MFMWKIRSILMCICEIRSILIFICEIRIRSILMYMNISSRWQRHVAWQRAKSRRALVKET